MPIACYTLPLSVRKKFCEWLRSIKFPDGYCSNLSRCVNVDDGKLAGMKSHDYHVFLQRVLPVFYIDDVKNGDNWKIVQKTNSRHIYNVPDVEENVSDLASNHEPYQQFEPDSNDVHQINIESNELLNQETEVDEIDSSLFSSKSGSMSNEGAIHASLSDEEDDHDYYDDDTITNYFDDGVGGCEQEEEEEL
ncbi:hypothetical protein V6N12_065336 [Hibiscus sabdariffa]|uniref:DUF4216 domain-containing protein n=1 Tax=Hibiscus sabdariffa TaxID=183260 RepID=A0ABR2G9V9_9ROSI